MVLNSDGETPELEMALDLEESLLRQSTRDPSSVEEAFLQTRLSFLPEAGFAQRSDEAHHLVGALADQTNAPPKNAGRKGIRLQGCSTASAKFCS